MPKLPNQIKTSTINEFLDKHNIQNQIVKQMMEETVKFENEKQQSEDFHQKPKKTGGLSERLLRMIRKKEEFLKKRKAKNEHSL